MPEYKTATERITVPKNTGLEGFLKTLRKILVLPRVQNIVINANGRITYERAVREDENMEPIEVDFSDISPGAIVRNCDLREIEEENEPTRAVARLFEAVAQDHLVPTAFVSGPGSTFWLWHEKYDFTLSSSRDQAYGVPFLYDEYFPPFSLVLCASYTRSAALSEIRKSFKIQMPEQQALMRM